MKIKQSDFYHFYQKSNPRYSLSVLRKETDEYEDVKDLSEDVDFNRRLQDVLYAGEDGKEYRLKYNTMQRNFDANEFRTFEQNNRYFIKSLAWYYEKETRVLITLTDEGYEKVKDSIKHDEDKFAVRMSFDLDVASKMQLLLGPNISVDEHGNRLEGEKLWDKVKNYPRIDALRKSSLHVEGSSLAGQVKMNLCKNCKGGKIMNLLEYYGNLKTVALEIERLINHFGGRECQPGQKKVSADGIELDFQSELEKGVRYLETAGCISESKRIFLLNTCVDIDDFHEVQNDLSKQDSVACLICRLKELSKKYYAECEQNED